MKLLLFIISIFLLSACSHLQFLSATDKSNLQLTGFQSENHLHEGCDDYPFDNSDTPCNLFGWQEFFFQTLSQTKEEHDAALLALGTSQEDEYKKLILLSEHDEPLQVRIQAKNAMFNISSENFNSFGKFFYIIASLQEELLVNEQKAIHLRSVLKNISQKNATLKAELADTQAKIQAIMDIEKNLNTN